MAEMSIENIRITADSCNVDFKQARRLAEEVVFGMVRSPRLIGWIDSKRGQSQPHSQEEMTHEPALAHESQVRVDINDNEYSFIFSGTN